MSLKTVDDALYVKWAGRALELLRAAEAPSYMEALRAEDPEATKRGLLGSSRSATLRLRVRTWESFSRWLRWRRGVEWPTELKDLVDYLHETMKESPTASFPRAFSAAVNWFEARAGFPRRFSAHEQFCRAVERAAADAGEAQDETKRAPRFPTSLPPGSHPSPPS